MANTYYILVVKWRDGENWQPEFGDYERETVLEEAEIEYAHKAYATHVLTIDGDTRPDIDKAVAAFNEQ
jgi:hypothetical protein